jgi:hypothetical protein
MRKYALAALVACLMSTPALAQGAVILTSAVFVEHLGHTGDGRVERAVEPANRFVSGDTVVLMVEWHAARGGNGFYVTSPIPSSLAFNGSSREGEQVSVDGGRHWGTLGALSTRDARGLRIASPQDVTNVRWPVSAHEAARGSGRITYSVVVR